MTAREDRVGGRSWWVLRAPVGNPNLERDLEFKELPIPKLTQDGTFLVRNLALSLDPYIRGTMNPVSYGREQRYPRLMTCGCVAQVLESRHPKFPPGAIVNGQFGWCDYAVTSGNQVRIVPPEWKPSWALGVLGMPGATAYLGLMEVIAPKQGDTVVVTSCTGAVGMLVGQIAKLKGCRTVGFTSTSKLGVAKALGYDHVIDYTGKDVPALIKELRKAAPGGVNGFFDNAGGPSSEATMMCLAQFARVAVCGQIAYYNLANPLDARTYPATMIALTRSAKIEGFMVNQLPKASPGDWRPAFEEMSVWLKTGQLKIQEDVTDGLENAFHAFMTLFHDSGSKTTNVGKKIVHVADATPLQAKL